jgi:hypothetical protein
MRLLLAFLLLLALAACNPRGAGNHENVGDNAKYLKELADDGFDMTQPMTFDFEVLVDGEADAKSLEAALAGKGYIAEKWELDGGIWAVSATRTFVPELSAVNQYENEVVAESDKARGYYEGWVVNE